MTILHILNILDHMQSDEIRKRFLAFFEKRGHAVLPSASLVPENDPSVLFTTAGMQPLVPYLLGEKHPAGTRLVNVQKCVRTQDINEVGDKTHDTFFEMLGNWSLGDYFKKEAIEWSWQLMTDAAEGFGLDPRRLYVTVFEGDENAPRDEEAAAIWKSIGVPENRIYFLPASKNWWQAGDNGPCGPDTEMYYDITGAGLGDMTLDEFKAADVAQKVVEIWNDVFKQFLKKDGKVVDKLAKQNVDTGAGLERFAMVLQKVDSIFETDLFADIMAAIHGEKKHDDVRAERIVADHVRTAVFMLADGVRPSNTDRGYILRRLIRRAVRFASKLGMKEGAIGRVAHAVVRKYSIVYENVGLEEVEIHGALTQEETKFTATLERGLKEFEHLAMNGAISAHEAFILFSSYGFPIEVTKELALEKGISIDEAGFGLEFKKHQDLSRSGAEQKFRGGLADSSEQTTKYHTATHMLGAALREVLGESVQQRGSNITAERLRFDFSFDRKMTDEEKQRTEEIVNEAIASDFPVSYEEMSVEDAKKLGAIGVFGEKYADVVKVYRIGDAAAPYSLEICGGPHVIHTGVLGHFKITKEEAVAQGVRRIKAVLE